ncbi:class C sortase [Bifidobacterium avesanii]|nr:class C sortase [Bifidobacterium avesanii]
MAKHAARRRNPGVAAVAVLLIVAGLGVCLYPAAANMLANRAHAAAIVGYRAAVSQLDAAALQRQWEAADRYNRALANGRVPVPDASAPVPGTASPDYDALLNVAGDGAMGYVTIPRIGLLLPIYHGTGEETLAKGVGHLRRSSLPVGGDGSHAILTGHRGLPSAELFTRLDELAVGDQFSVTVLERSLTYRVTSVRTVEPREIAGLGIEPGRDLVTLVTCTPYGVNTHRLVITGERVGDGDAVDAATAPTGDGRIPYMAWIAGGITVLLSALAIGAARTRSRIHARTHTRTYTHKENKS